VAFVGYDLCPSVEIDQIAAQCHAAMRWLFAEGASLGVDLTRVIAWTGTREPDPPAFERLLSAAGRAYLSAAQKGGSAIPAWRWGEMADRFRGMLKAATSLWAEAEHGGVKGARPQ
jgi:hypothetical protein